MPYYEGHDQNGRIVTITQRSTVGEAAMGVGGSLSFMADMVGLESPMDKFLNLLLFLESEVLTISLIFLMNSGSSSDDWTAGIIKFFVGVFLALVPYFLVLQFRVYREIIIYATVVTWVVLGIISLQDSGELVPFLIYMLVAGISYLVHRSLNSRLAFAKDSKIAQEKYKACLQLLRPEPPFVSDFRPSMPYWIVCNRGSRGRYDNDGFHLEVGKFEYMNCPYSEKYTINNPYQIAVKAQIEKYPHKCELIVAFNEVDPQNYTIVKISSDMKACVQHHENKTCVLDVSGVTIPGKPEEIIDIEIRQSLHELTVKVNNAVIANGAKVSLPPISPKISIGGHFTGSHRGREKAIFCFKSFAIDALKQEQ